MAEGRGRFQWSQTSAILAVLINANRTKGKQVKPDDLNPYRPRRSRKVEPIARVDTKFLGGLFGVKPRPKK